FSSRRRHTRFSRDWSSDVCSSDLYRHRISVEVAGPGFEAGALDLPHGDPHTDEFFGEVETFRHALRATLPGHASAGAGPIHLKEIGRASGRGRWAAAVGAGAWS